MKSALLTLALALASCGPVDPVTGIILDAPAHWRGSPDPLDTPETFQSVPTANGAFGHGWLWR